MSFAHPFVLLLLLLPLAYGIREWRRTTRRAALVLKLLSLAAILAAFAEPSVTMPETRTGVAVLLDTSASIPDRDLARETSLAVEMARNRGRNWLRAFPFARRVRDLADGELQSGGTLRHTALDAGQATDFEAALRAGVSAIPSGLVPRLVLITDGKENQGSTARAVAQLQRLNVPVDTIALGGRPETGLRLLSVSMPRNAYQGEQIPIDLTLDAPSAGAASVAISADGKPLGQNAVTLRVGVNQLRVHARVNSSGAVSIAGHLTATDSGEVEFHQAVNLKQAQVLYLSLDPSGADSNLLQALSQAQFDVIRDRARLDAPLAGLQLVILNNLNLDSISPAEKSRIEEFVRNGGGLLLIGGERQQYKDDKHLDALDNALPAKLAPPKTPEGTCVALVIDKSSSMEGRKIELARLSAIGVVDHLRPTDTIGVLIFDNSYQWAVPMRRAEDTALIKRLISGITPDGGTQIAPALTEAYRKVLAAHATYKHIVLLTDGISEEGDSLEVSKEAQSQQLTISTVGLGQDVNRGYLEKIAELSGGKSYFLNDPQGLEQILLKDVLDYTGSTAVERALKPIVDHNAEVLQDVDMASAPALKGYTRFKATPTAETILSIDIAKKDPLYVRWQYGLGRSAVFTSDAKSRWASAWVTWPGFDKFWINVARDLLPRSQASEAVARFDPANQDLVVDYHLGPGVPEPEAAPEIFVLGHDGFQKPVDVVRSAPGDFHGRLHIGARRGLFRIRPLAESRAFPEVGLYRQEEESLDYGSDTALLRQIANLTGGRFDPAPADVFRGDGRSLSTVWHLWPGLLALAIALSIAELVARKWRGILQRFTDK